ncbi:MAG: nitrate reductase [Proteobacteria bacterium]|nr:nitrate reductase [Pseudomonadota bacterium]
MKNLFRQRSGPLTRDLTLRPGNFGLGLVPDRHKPDDTVNLVCGYCSTGCSLTVHCRDGRAVNATPTVDYPVNRGLACAKGWQALAPLEAPDRATVPLVRDGRGRLSEVDWDTALTLFVNRFKDIQRRHGAGSVAFLSTGQLVTEEMAYLGALAKFGMGMVHGDGNTRQCMATAVVAYKQAFGFDAPPYTYRDLEESDVIVLIGSNLCIAHPILWQRIGRNSHQPEIVVVDPRRTETAMAATQHYAVAPKSDLVLFYGLASRLIAMGCIDRDFIEAHTESFDEFARHVERYTLDAASKATGLAVDQIQRLADTIAGGERVSLWWTMGVNQSHEGVALAQAIINLALITGNIGRPGTGANSITGQCNAMGSRLFSNTSSLMGGRDFARQDHRRQVAEVLGLDTARIPDTAGLAYDQILHAIRDRAIRGLWVIATNTAHSWIDQRNARDALDRLEFLVVQDLYPDTDTARLADLVLPAAGWAEKDGTFINSERRIGRVRKVRRAPGQALADFHIFRAVADYWGCGDLFRTWQTPEDVFQTVKELSRGMPCDMTGIRDYRMLDQLGGVQWPFPAGTSPGQDQRRLFEDGAFFHPHGRARLLVAEPIAMPEPTSESFPFLLITGRGSSSQWHTQTRTGRSGPLRALVPHHPYAEISPDDARELGIGPGQPVVVWSRRGQIQVYAFLSHIVRPGQIFIPMHYAVANQLTHPSFDPRSRQPAYKACAVNVRRLGRDEAARDPKVSSLGG